VFDLSPIAAPSPWCPDRRRRPRHPFDGLVCEANAMTPGPGTSHGLHANHRSHRGLDDPAAGPFNHGVLAKASAEQRRVPGRLRVEPFARQSGLAV